MGYKTLGQVVGLAICLTTIGCAGQCIKIEGAYKDYKGGLTWCLDKPIEGRDTLKDENSGEKAIIIPESELETINKALQPQIKALGLDKKRTPIEEYLHLIRSK